MKLELVFVQDQQRRYWVSGRSLCSSLAKDTAAASGFLKWIVSRARGFTDGDDYMIIKSRALQSPLIKGDNDYLLTLKLAATIARRDGGIDAATLITTKLEELNTTGAIVDAIQYNASTPAKAATSGQFNAPLVGMNPELGVTKINTLGFVVRARTVYNRVAVPTSKSSRDLFSDWFNARVKKYDLVADVDFVSLPSSVLLEGNKKASIDAWVTVKTAKLLAKVQAAGAGMETYQLLQQEEEAIKRQEVQPATAPQQHEPELPFSTSDAAETAKVSSVLESAIEAGRQLQALNDVAKWATPSRVEGTVNGPSSMPVLVSKTRLELLMEQQQKVQQEIEQEEAKQKQVEVTPAPEQLAEVLERLHLADQRINAMECWISTFTGLMQQGATFLAGELPIGTPDLREVTAPDAPQAEKLFQTVDFSQEPVDIKEAMANTPRRKLIQLVNDYAEAKDHPYQEIWRYLYGQLHTSFGFNVSRGKHSKENYLDYAERSDQLDNLLSIAQSNLRPVMNVAQA